MRSRRLQGLKPEIALQRFKRGKIIPKKLKRIQVKNPESNRSIFVNGQRFKELTGARGKYIYDPAQNKLERKTPVERFITVTKIWMYDAGGFREMEIDTEDRHTRFDLDDNELSMLERVVAGTMTPEAFVNTINQTRNNYVLGNVAEFTWGEYTFTNINGNDNGGGGFVFRGQLGANDLLEERVFDNNPLRIPYINTELNAGNDENCIERAIGFKPVDKSINGIIETAKQNNFSVKVFDILGGVIAEHGEKAPFGGKTLIMYNNHAYPVKGEKPVLVEEKETYNHKELNVYDKLKNDCHMLFVKNNKYYTVDSILQHERAVKPWMTDLMNIFPKSSFEKETMKTITSASRSLLMNSLTNNSDEDETMYQTLDMKKCYFNIFTEILRTNTMIQTNIFTKWKPYNNNDIKDNCAYRITNEDVLTLNDNILSKMGFQTNILIGSIVKLLQKNGINLRISDYIEFDIMSEKAQNKGYAFMKKISDDKVKKEYAICNGAMGITESNQSTMIEIHNDNEAQYYEDKYGFKKYGKSLSKSEHVDIVVNHLNIHFYVIQMANYAVLKKMFEIKKETGAEPVKIKVDSLSYYGDPDCTFDLSKYENKFWKIETFKFVINQTSFSPITVAGGRNPHYLNKTFLGAPGSGKTHHVTNNLDFDLAVCYSNKGARRINGKTIHSAFNIWGDDGTPDLWHLKNKVIFVDEAQCVNRKIWGIFAQAYEHGARFIFAMDLNQLTPVGEPEIEISDIHGEITEFKKDWRNDKALIEAREQVLADTFEPTVAKKGTKLTKTNIAFTNKTCRKVNKKIAKKLNLSFGDDGGTYIALETNKELGIMKSEILKKKNSKFILPNGDKVIIPEKFYKFTPKEHLCKICDASFKTKSGLDNHNTKGKHTTKWKPLIDWGYCTTIHKQIGETITEDFTIWDVNHPRFGKKLLYTAITRGKKLSQIIFRD